MKEWIGVRARNAWKKIRHESSCRKEEEVHRREEEAEAIALPSDSICEIALLKACVKEKDLHQASIIHANIVKKGLLEKDRYLGNTLVSLYAKCGALSRAQQVFERLPVRNVVSWNALIAGYAQHEHSCKQALTCFQRMQHHGVSPNAVTYVCILKACGSIGRATMGKEIHNTIVQKGLLETNILVGNTLVDMYAKCSAVAKARQVFEQLPCRTVVSWNALISGYTQCGNGEEALHCFEQMQQKGLSPDALTYVCILKACSSNIQQGRQIHEQVIRCGFHTDKTVCNALIDMYVKCGLILEAQDVFDKLPVRDVVTWNAIISGYVQQGRGEEALICFTCMQEEGFSPDVITLTCIVKACGSTGAIEKGKQIHDDIISKGLLGKHIVLGNALVDMYANNGALSEAKMVFNRIQGKDVVSWNTLITGYVENGFCEEALNFLSNYKWGDLFLMLSLI